MTMLDSHLSACTPSSPFSAFVHLILPPTLWLQPCHTWLGSDTVMKGLLWTMSSIPKPYKYLSSLLYIVREEGAETEMGRCYFSKQKGLMCADGIRETGILTQCVERRWEVNLDLTLSQEPSQYLTVSWLQCVWSCQRTTLHFTWIKKSYVGGCSDWTHAGLLSCPQPFCFVYLIWLHLGLVRIPSKALCHICTYQLLSVPYLCGAESVANIKTVQRSDTSFKKQKQ